MTKQSLKDKGAYVALGLAACALVAVVVVTNRSGDPPDDGESGVAQQEATNKPAGPAGTKKEGYTEVGGVYRPESDLNFAERPATDRDRRKPIVDPGLSPAVDPNANPQVASVYEALKTRENPERFSSFVRPAAFDPKAYEADPDAYINVIEPGRVFQPAQPGPDVKRIQAVSARYQRVTQGEQVPMVVKAVPGAPVTFTSFNLGHFENQLTSITVKADAKGEAAVRYTAAKGSIDGVNVLAASPLTSSQAEFRLLVRLPKSAGDQIADAAP